MKRMGSTLLVDRDFKIFLEDLSGWENIERWSSSRRFGRGS